ncbi:uncharacterized protein LOC143345562 isoform X3 [Colletes latitarsis]|uniref:uncharacterized protein LOC143345562 isoform X3 n=1 Tax=Colletes latitarsis TaxID=2605962 RepID=UPI0040365F3F
MSSLDYLDLCRLCLVKDRVSVPIFDGEGDVRQIFLKIAACLPVKVAREDKLPKKICDDCVYKVELFYQFWNTTVNAEKQLLQWLGEVGMEGKQGYVTNVLNPNVMKQEQSTENRLDGSVMQQVSEHQNNMGIGMMDNIGLGIPMIISNTNQQQQITSVPMDTSSNSAQNVQAVPGPSSQTTHNQISQNQTSSTQQEEEEESSEDEENSDDECDGDEGLPVKEESEEDPNSRTIEPTTFVNVSLACDEAGPSGLQQQKIADMPEIPMPQTADGDPKSGMSTIGETSTTQNPPQPLFIERIGSFMDLDKMKIQIKTPPVSTDDDDSSVECDFESSSLVIEYKPRENISNIDNLRRGEMNYCSMSNRVNDSLISSKETTTFPRTEVGGNDCIPKIEEEHCVEPVLTPMMPVTDAETEQGTSMFDSIEVMDEIQLNTDGGVLTTKQYESGSEISFNPDAQQRDKKKKKGPCQPKAVRRILPKPTLYNSSESVGVNKKQSKREVPKRAKSKKGKVTRPRQKKQEGIPGTNVKEIYLTKGRPILPKPAIFNKERITIAEEFDLRKTQELVEGVGVNGKQLMKGTAILPKPTVFNSSEIGQFNVQKTQEGIESVGLNKQQLAEISIVPIRTNSKEKGIARIPQFNVQLSKKREITTVEELDLQKTQEIVEGVGVKGKQLMKGTAILPKPTVSNSSEIEQFNVQKTQEGIGSVGLSKQQLEVSIVPIQTNSKKRKLIRRQMFNVQKKQEGIPSINVGSSILPKPVISNKEEEEITIVEEFDLRKTQGVVEGADGKGKQLMKGTAILPKPTVSNSSEIEQFDVQKTQEGIESVGVAKKQSKRGRPKRTGSKRRKVTRPQQFSVQKEQKEIPSINIDEILLTKGRPILPKPTISNKEKITIAEEFDAQITREIIEFVNDEHLPKQRLIVPKPTINQSSEIIVIQDFYPHNMNMRMRPILPKPTSEPAPNRIGITSSSAIACPFCYRSYNKELSLEAHFRKWHRSHYLCKKCHYIYESQDALDEHYQVHAAPGMLQCSICKRRYKQLRRFEEHKTRYHTIKELETIYKSESIRLCACINKCPKPARSLLWKLTCKRCNNAFPQHSSLVALERPGDSIQNKVSNIVKCETCNKCFPSEDDLHLHAKLHERNFICNECGKEFREKFILRLHIRKHFD